MILERSYLQCLSHGSYFLADPESKEAAVVDPRRDAGIYLGMLRDGGYRLKYVLETHLHADFVSGHVELAARTGATIVFGAEARAAMPHLAVRDGDTLMLGNTIRITVLATPGHTPESVCYLARDQAHPEEPMKLFSGDTLFVGDVGRPDLLDDVVPAGKLASQMYDSLRDKLLVLPDATEVYPAHGAGSACGRNLGEAAYTTIGEQRRTNYALRPMPREEFIRLVTEDQPEAPAYFRADARINREGPETLDQALSRMRPLAPAAVEAAMAAGQVLLDTRDPDTFALGSIPGALQVGLDGQFASWVGTLVPRGAPVILLCEPGREREAALRCARVGCDDVRGYLEGGFEAWEAEGRPVAAYRRADADGLREACRPGSPTLVVDVRRPAERAEVHIPGTLHIPLNHLLDRVRELPGEDRPVLIHCASGYRSAIAVSLLRQRGFRDVRDAAGGLRRYRERGYPVAAGPERKAGPDA